MDHWRGTCAYTSPENFLSLESPLAKVIRVPFYPYSADAWALAVVIAEVRKWCTSGMLQIVIPSSCSAWRNS